MLKRIVRKLLNRKLPESIQYEVISYAQEGEDVIVKRMLSSEKNGFYIDIGAHHPFRFSNTYLFYKSGWRGINIDPIPGIKELFDEFRPNDINLELAISTEKQILTYYNFKEKALNTFSEPLAQQYIDAKWELENKILITTFPLKEILEKHLPASKEIDFMTIDVEGFEMNVLASNDWTKYKPKVLLIEILDCSIEEAANNEISGYLKSKSYTLFAKTFNTFFFKLDQ